MHRHALPYVLAEVIFQEMNTVIQLSDNIVHRNFQFPVEWAC